jgi:hypothetical protein
MSNKNNIGESILLLGLLFLNIYFKNDYLLIISIILAIIGLSTWNSIRTDKDSLKLNNEKLRSEINLNDAKTEYYRRKK